MADAQAVTHDPKPGPQQWSTRQRLLKRWFMLDQEFLTWKPRLQDISRFVYPEGGRFELDQQNKGYRHDQWIVNDTPLDARRKLAAGLDTAVTNEDNEWFGLTTADSTPSEAQRAYLHEVRRILFDILAGSNFYEVNRNNYDDLASFGTSLMFIEEDDKEVVRFVHIPMGQYRLAVDSRGRVNFVGRQFSMTVLQVVERFCTSEDGTVDLSNVSSRVKAAWEAQPQRLDEWVVVLHIVERRQRREYGKRDKKNKRWGSYWLEWNNNSGNPQSQADSSSYEPDGLLAEDGYDDQPFTAPRWNVKGEDAYGKDSPGWQSLGDCKGLQALELVGAKGVAKIMDPPMNAPNSLKNASQLPGAVNYLPHDKEVQFTPSVMIPPEAVTVADKKAERHEFRINRAFFAELLLMLANDESAQKDTAEAVRGKEKERVLQLAGVFARLARELLEVVIHRLLMVAQRKGRIPPPPPEMAGVTVLNIEFQNVLVQAQKELGLAANDRLVATAANLATAGRTDALDKLNPDAILDDTADRLGTNPKLLLTDEQVAQIRSNRAKQQQAAQQGEAMTKAAPALKQLSETNPEQLQQILQQFGPNAAAGGLPQ